MKTVMAQPKGGMHHSWCAATSCAAARSSWLSAACGIHRSLQHSLQPQYAGTLAKDFLQRAEAVVAVRRVVLLLCQIVEDLQISQQRAGQ